MRSTAHVCMPILLLALICNTTAAATWHVRAGAAGDGSAANPYGKIQQAITAAASGDTIKVAEGTYVENLSITSKSLTLEGGWDAAFAERDWEKHVTTVDGNQAGSCMVFIDCATGALSGFRITNAKTLLDGGGVRCTGSSVRIAGNTICGNEADEGGGIYATKIPAPMVIVDNTISDNTANLPGNGGGICIDATSSSLVTIRANTIAGNHANSGGGIFHYASASAPIVITDNAISNNSAEDSYGGGGIHCRGSAAMITGNLVDGNVQVSGGAGASLHDCQSLTITGNTFTGNSKVGLYVETSSYQATCEPYEISANLFTADSLAAIMLSLGGSLPPTTLAVANNTITNNSGVGIHCTQWSKLSVVITGNNITGNDGAGIAFFCSSKLSPTHLIAENIICGNASITGAGLYIWGLPESVYSMTVERNTITGNTSTSLGGGVNISTSGGTLTVVNNVVSDNTAYKGGGMALTSSSATYLSIAHNVVVNNTATEGGGLYCSQVLALAFTNNVICYNSATGKAGAMSLSGSSLSGASSISNNVFWNNSAPRYGLFSLTNESTAMLSYNIVASDPAETAVPSDCSLTWSAGNIDADPLFADAEGGDYHPKSMAGRWDPKANDGTGAWMTDSVHSPCIDAGDPTADSSTEPEPNSGRINIGLFGGTPEASKSYTGPTHSLAVRSVPITGVTVFGSCAGTTDFIAAGIPGSEVSLNAWQAQGLFFLRWEDENGTVLSRRTKLTVHMDSDKTVVAVFGEVTQFYVNDATPDEGIAAGDDGNSGTSPELPMATIQKLLDRYPTIGADCTVNVGPGRYVENILLGSAHSGLTLRGTGPGFTVIDGNQAGSCLRLSSLKGGTIAGLVLTNGKRMDSSGIYSVSSSATITGCIITGNTTTGTVGATATVYCSGGSPTIRNTIIWGNSSGAGWEVMLSSGSAAIDYCDIEGGRDVVYVSPKATLAWGDGNIDADPCFADPQHGDYHLQSFGGRCDPAQNTWVTDASHSPCIDAGDPAGDFTTEPMPNGGRLNMGAEGNTAQASRSYTGPTCTLTVRSTPDSSMAISGTVAGTTDFSVTVVPGIELFLRAQPTGQLALHHWEDDAGNILTDRNPLVISIVADKTVVAVYHVVTEFYVNDSVPDEDYGPAGDDRNSGTAADQPMRSLNALLARYPGIGDGCTIHVAPGTYTGGVYLGPTHAGLTLAGAGPGVSTISGGDGCLTLEGFAQGVIDGFTFIGGSVGIACLSSSPVISNNAITGNSSSFASPRPYALGIVCLSWSPIIVGNIISGNTTTDRNILAGGIYCDKSSPIITSNTITGNAVSSSYYKSAGGIYCTATSVPLIINNTIAANTVEGGGVGGIYCLSGATIAGNTITGNTASGGSAGGIYCSASAIVQDNTIEGNISGFNYGGGICVGGGAPFISRNIISNNTAIPDDPDYTSAWSGGGIYCRAGSPTISGNTITNNSAYVGGGIGCNDATPTITDNVITGNSASAGEQTDLAFHAGGGIWCQRGTSAVIARNTISGNHAPNGGGGGIACSSCPAEITDNSITNNDAYLQGGGIYCVGTRIPTISGNTITGNKTAIHAYPDDSGEGGGIYCPLAATITGNTITGNSAEMRGGGVFIGAATFTNNTVSGNASGSGAGIYCSGAASCSGNTITGNTAIVSGGGAYCAEQAVITANTISANTADYGAGLYGKDHSITVSANTISQNIASGKHREGGGIYCLRGSLSVTNNAITGNVARSGGGIYYESSSATIDANTISGNTANGSNGGGICGKTSSGSITGNAVSGNTAVASLGGGICLLTPISSPNCMSNRIIGNSARQGGGMYFSGTSAYLTAVGCLIAGNTATTGAGVYSSSVRNLSITNCSFAGNVSTATSRKGTGLYVGASGTSSRVALLNSVFWDDGALAIGEINLSGGSSAPVYLDVRYCDIAGGADGIEKTSYVTLTWGPGNLATDPLFASPGHWNDNGTPADLADDTFVAGDYHLKSRYGRWDPAANAGAGAWIIDTVTSPCIDAGDPASDYSKEPQPNYARVNMGAYGNTLEASKSRWTMPGDVNADCKVNILDILLVRSRLNQDASSSDNAKADPNQDGKINILDIILVRGKLNTACK